MGYYLNVIFTFIVYNLATGHLSLPEWYKDIQYFNNNKAIQIMYQYYCNDSILFEGKLYTG